MGIGSIELDELEGVFRNDPVIFDIYKRFGFPKNEKSEDIFNDLIRSIIGQQLSVKVAKSIYQRFIALFEKSPGQEDLVEMDVELLRGVGLSYQKASYVRNVALFFKENKLENKEWDKMDDLDILDLLTQIKGVGKWTVEMLLMFSFGRQDVFPIDDLGIRQGMKRFYKVESEGKDLRKDLTKIAENWRPYRTIASKLIWLGKDNL